MTNECVFSVEEQKNRTKHYFYACPFCHTATGEMALLDNSYTPTQADLAKRPDMEHIATEQMLCPCGATLTWFDVDEIEYIVPGILIPTKRP